MKRITKKEVMLMQQCLASWDFSVGLPPRKSGKTYIMAYALCYEYAARKDALTEYAEKLSF